MTMRDEDKPFLTTKNGWSMQIVPRNAAGWRAFALWLVLAGLITGAYLLIMEGGLDTQNGGDMALVTVAFVIAMTIWAVAMSRWMYSRSEVIDVRKVVDERRRQSRKP